MAADQVSRHNCAFCGEAAKPGEPAAAHVCPACGRPQPLGADRDYFAALGVPRGFAQDRPALEKRFYEISRALHPDRFIAADPESRRLSLERMSFVNDAYATLKSPERLREYLLETEGALKPDAGSEKAARGQVPMELAEGWFELQDALSEDPGAAAEKLPGFEARLRERLAEADRALSSLERSADSAEAGARREVMEEMARELRARTYLVSLSRDVERLRGRLAGGIAS